MQRPPSCEPVSIPCHLYDQTYPGGVARHLPGDKSHEWYENAYDARAYKLLCAEVYISQLIRFARASSNLNDFNYRNKALTAKLLRQGYRYFKLRKAFSKFYRRHSALLEKYSVSLKTLLQQGISEPEFYCVQI